MYSLGWRIPWDVENLCNVKRIRFQQDLDSLSIWASNKELMFQPTKCENLRITCKRNSAKRLYTLKVVTSAQDLVVQISYNLMWADHIVDITSKANRMLGFLRRHCSKGVPCDIQKTLYILLVRSHLIYASQVWSPRRRGSIYLMRNLESVQRRATRFILGGFELDYKCWLIQLKLLPLPLLLS